MAPYFEQGGVAIYHGDCVAVLADLGIEADMVMADPNYGATKLEWDRLEFEWLAAATARAKLTASLWCFGSFSMFLAMGSLFAEAGWRFAQDIVWEKHNGSTFHADRFRRVHEQAAHFYRTGARWEDVYKEKVVTNDATARQVRRNKRPPHMGSVGGADYVSQDGGPRLMRSVIYARSCHGYADIIGQKPLSVVRALVKHSCPPDGLLLDPMMGSGTALVVAKEAGLRAIGIDRSEKNCEVAASRLVQTLALTR